MRYSEGIIEEVRQRNPIVDVIGSYIHLTKKGGNYFGLCPFHNEKSGSFSVSPSRQMYHCFGCGVGGSVINFVMQYENLSFPEAIQQLAERVGMDLPKQEYSREQKAEADLRSRLLALHRDAAIYYVHQLHDPRDTRGRQYFEARKLSAEIIQSFGLGYTGKWSNGLYTYLKEKGYSDIELKESGLVSIDERGAHDKFWNRVMFPIMDANSRVIAFGGRIMGSGEPKYLNSPETKLFDKSRNLYGLNVAKKTREPYFLICEGYMDVLSMHQAGFTNAVASLGTAFTDQHGMIVKRYTKEVVLCYDSDGAGRKAALRAIPLLRKVGLKIRVLNMSPYKDPDEFMKNLGRDEFLARIRDSRNAFLFEIDCLRDEYDFEDPQDKANFFHETARRTAQFADEIERNSYMEAVAKNYGIEYSVFKTKVNQIGNQIGFTAPAEDEWRPKAEMRDLKRPKIDPMTEYEKLIFADLLEKPDHFMAVSSVLSPDEFGTDVSRRIAAKLFDQLRSGRMDAGHLFDYFTSEEDQTAVANLLSGEMPEGLDTLGQREAITEAVRKVKGNAIDRAMQASTDTKELMQLMEARKELNSFTIRFQ